MKRIFTILGCGSSGGVPRLGPNGGNWGKCDPSEPKNRRRRCSLLIEQHGADGTTAVLIDTGPDMRSQLLDAGIGALDGVVYTHSHADHVHGLDDLRQIVYNMKERLDVWSDKATTSDLISRFGYAFVQPPGSNYPPILNLHEIDGDITISGAGGDITLTPFEVEHGTIDALGFRIGDVAYLPDVSKMDDNVFAALHDLDCFIIDALRRDPHPTHFHLDAALAVIKKLAPKRAVLTNMHLDLDYATLEAETPDHITPAFDGMQITYDL
ncbi:MBL fold metallo-hydrolase [Nereida sp. MMG025]|uniref:MBL fold metallo-hydrolase n=1 Tax=Nereida sp. MMG025 TaxID=2909981 RepID=UPI001F426321|nr:MBL fold metallo-hydrolase [Nereida sp. MMG025]MCF6443766.1 MBL fold metallo-hydrolase [Nereida sp. MMG025]